MLDLTRRQEMILGLIVQEYVQAPSPISSKLLVDTYLLNYSSATIRNDMMVLEEAGLIMAPHTSAGRIPTEKGYRYCVQRLLGDTSLSSAEERMISHQFYQASPNMENWLRLSASVLAQTARAASLVTSPQPTHARFKHLELVNTQGRLVLLVLVLEGGDVRQQMLTLSEPVGQERLSLVANHITAKCGGLGGADIGRLAVDEGLLEQEIMELVGEILSCASQRYTVLHYDGLLNILDPDYRLEGVVDDPQLRADLSAAISTVDSPGARQTLHLLEEQSLIEDIITDALVPEIGAVQVMIAGDGRWEELSHTSMVISRYGVSGQVTGAVGVLGPTRLHYGRAISAVRFVAGLMSDMMIELYGEGRDPGDDGT